MKEDQLWTYFILASMGSFSRQKSWAPCVRHVFMTVKRPAGLGVKSLGRGFGNVMQDGRPPQPQRVAVFSHVVSTSSVW